MLRNRIRRHFRQLRQDQKLSEKHALCKWFKLDCNHPAGRVCPLKLIYGVGCTENKLIQKFIKTGNGQILNGILGTLAKLGAFYSKPIKKIRLKPKMQIYKSKSIKELKRKGVIG